MSGPEPHQVRPRRGRPHRGRSHRGEPKVGANQPDLSKYIVDHKWAPGFPHVPLVSPGEFDTKIDLNSEFEGIDPIEKEKESLENYLNELRHKAEHHSILSNQDKLRYLENSIKQVVLKRPQLYCIDVEAYERNQSLVTEIGISMYKREKYSSRTTPLITAEHIIIKEHLKKRNGKFVPDNKDNFLSGQSFLMSSSEAKRYMQDSITQMFDDNYAILIGHGIGSDIDWLASEGIYFPENVEVIDTQKLWACSRGKNGGSLEKILKYLEIPYSNLHNAGNDAFFTLQVFLKLCDPKARIQYNLDTEVTVV